MECGGKAAAFVFGSSTAETHRNGSNVTEYQSGG
jgi:hypothetical protein